jgi:hypothetical protein
MYDGGGCYGNPWYCRFYGYSQIDPTYDIASNPKIVVLLEFDTEEIKAALWQDRGCVP